MTSPKKTSKNCKWVVSYVNIIGLWTTRPDNSSPTVGDGAENYWKYISHLFCDLINLSNTSHLFQIWHDMTAIFRAIIASLISEAYISEVYKGNVCGIDNTGLVLGCFTGLSIVSLGSIILLLYLLPIDVP